MKAKKQALREEILLSLRQQPEPSRQAKSLQIGRRLFRTAYYRRAKRLLCYASVGGEVGTREILEKALSDGKQVFVPVVTDTKTRSMVAARITDLSKDLAHRGHYGIPHPLRLTSRRVSSKSLDLILLPGVAFDRHGGRLGRGAGYFDRFLAEVPARVPRVGLAFGFQVLKNLPREPHDQAVCAVITEKAIIQAVKGKK